MKNFRFLLFTALLLMVGIAAHTALWHWGAATIRQEIDQLYIEADVIGLRVEGARPQVGGYPFAHQITFHGRISDVERTLEIPHLRARGLFLPGQSITIDFSSGLALRGGDLDPEIWSLSRLYLQGQIPALLPAALTREDLTIWREAGGVIELSAVRMEKRQLQISGSGTLGVDEQLQPAGQIEATLSGDYVDFLSFLKQKRVIDTRAALMVGAVMGGLMTQDPDSNESYLAASLTLQNRNLLLGPLNLATLPVLHWPWRNGSRPAPPQ